MAGYTVRMSDNLRKRIRIAAAEGDKSMNQWIVDTIQEKLKEKTNMFTNLDELLDAMKVHDPRVMDPQHPSQWSTSLPTFGGHEPANTMEVWSWDERSLLVGSCAEDLEIVDRGSSNSLENTFRLTMPRI